ncbi:DUF4175 family protein [Epibacterium sp. SM1969]|uniref:DUF4175 family protein n=1 Tax=Tritonibacter aquimaris TaxID=2663379 RepID=A0A844AST4_9RHOB|nr:DUF4175 domain-containing protein [Tritonibacter aquimaris]MQY42348.1 DUF4175 family protein [Tritonibacter aquimaris]
MSNTQTLEKTRRSGTLDPRLRPLKPALWLTRLGMFAQNALRALWPATSLVAVLIAALMLGLQDALAPVPFWALLIGCLAAITCALIWAGKHLHWPTWAETQAHLDETLKGRPIAALLDQQAIGQSDAASVALWHQYQEAMRARAAKARAPRPDLALTRFDPYALRYMAALLLVVALCFGSLLQISNIWQAKPAVAATGPSWEGWLEPPQYTGLPVLYLADQPGTELSVPENSRITLRFYGEAGALTLSETLSDGTAPTPEAAEHSFTVTRSGDLTIEGQGGHSWQVAVLPDQPPSVAVLGAPSLGDDDSMELPFEARDDHGVTGGQVRIELDLLAIERRHGLAADPDTRTAIELDLPLPYSGDLRAFGQTLLADFSQHPWANLPVVYHFTVEDGALQRGESAGFGAPLVARRFFDPVAAAIVEQRRDLLWARANGRRVAQILRVISHRPEDVIRDKGAYLQLRTILRRLETQIDLGLTAQGQDDIAAALWDLALKLEEGDIGDALERMRRAQERLSQAMRDGASPEEIARLMQDLRAATEDYMRQLSRQAENSDERGEQSGETLLLSQQDLQSMMDRIQELMEQGRMAEAEQALREFQQLMENMRVTQGQPGQGGNEGEDAMQGLAETLREQQGLSDRAFRDLQEQFNPNAQRGESQGNQGQSGGLGQGQDHQQGQGQGQSGENGQSGQQPGQQQPGGSSQGQSGGSSRAQPGGQPGEGSLADRQRALRDELNRQENGLPYGATPEGETMRDAIGRAGRAMEDAEEALRQGDLAEAIDNQSEAMEALREGMRALGEAMAEQQQQGSEGQAGGPPGQAGGGNGQDPLGRGDYGASEGGSVGDAQAYRRAWDLLEDIRRRSGDQGRSPEERNYLERLLDRF